PDYKFRETNKTTDYLSKFPLGKVPAIETPGGLHIAESRAIARYVAASGPKSEQLLGSTPEERAVIDMRLEHDAQEFGANCLPALNPRFGHAPHDPQKEADGLAKVEVIIGIMEDNLKKHKWIAGTSDYSMADLAVAQTVFAANKFWLGREWRDKH